MKSTVRIFEDHCYTMFIMLHAAFELKFVFCKGRKHLSGSSYQALHATQQWFTLAEAAAVKRNL
jgi:hypothetical protein